MKKDDDHPDNPIGGQGPRGIEIMVEEVEGVITITLDRRTGDVDLFAGEGLVDRQRLAANSPVVAGITVSYHLPCFLPFMIYLS